MDKALRNLQMAIFTKGITLKENRRDSVSITGAMVVTSKETFKREFEMATVFGRKSKENLIDMKASM
jgi:hypothetical protein